ncbi:hypothetical protein ABZ135_35240 [Streptomyces sp. NPDC006339]|uniref:hypothetical protein n=1 Tax=Streptomyces sp. NPDC006339 TaxID=3156755 RepID=UPI0033B1B51A
MRERIRKVLKAARTSEPYPVWVTWEELASRVYGWGHRTKSDVQNVRRAAEQMHDVELLRFRDTNKHAGPRLRGTPEEIWLQCKVLDVYSGTMDAVNYSSYRPPTADHVLEAFWNGSRQEGQIRVDLGAVVSLVNKYCQTKFDPSEVLWWRLGLEEQRRKERRVLLEQLHRTLGDLCAEKARLEWEARQIKFGPVRIDPMTVTQCPCCQRSVEPGYFPVQGPTVLSTLLGS